jgi:RNA polymerase-binding transcription factor DksA
MPKKKTTSAKKKVAKKTVKKAVTKTAKKAGPQTAVKKASKKTAKKSAGQSAKKTPANKVSEASGGKKASTGKALSKEAALPKSRATGPDKLSVPKPKSRSSDSKSAPIVFSLDDVEELMAKKKGEQENEKKTAKKAAKKKTAPQPNKVVVDDQPAEQRVWGAASLADILGFNPAEKKKSTDLSSEEIPKKWKKYYNLLIELRQHVTDELNLHTSDTLKHSSRDDSGDLSGYGSHQADAGTETFDRDFALSLVSSEQEALNEIEEAILRIKDGSYGICEVTGKPIPAARLTAVPFARFSVDGQAEYEKNLRRKVDRSGNTGLFGDASDAPKLAGNDDDE